jgi:hypothetical protein
MEPTTESRREKSESEKLRRTIIVAAVIVGLPILALAVATHNGPGRYQIPPGASGENMGMYDSATGESYCSKPGTKMVYKVPPLWRWGTYRGATKVPAE